MKIGFDVDGVLVDLKKFELEYGSKFFKKKYNMDIKNINGFSIKEIFDCTDKQEYEFWKEYIVFYSIKYPIRPGASEIINKLIEDGNEIFIITSRIKTAEDNALGALMRFLLKDWLKKNNIDINPNNFKFCSTTNSAIEKAEFCKNNEIDFMIDDDVDNINMLKNVTNAICFATDYNDKVKDVLRTNVFYDIYNNIVEHYNNKFHFLKRDERNKLSKSELIEYYQKLKESYLNSKTLIALPQTEETYLSQYPLLKKLFDSKFQYEIENEHLIPKEDGVIYVANHKDMIDPPLIMSAIGRKPVHLLLKSEFLNTPFSSFLKSIGCVFVFRGNKDSEISSSEELSKILLQGSNIIIFPEGTRNKTEETLLPFKTGAVTIAQRTGAPIVPISITKETSGKISIKFGEKFYVSYFDDILEKNDELKKNIENMINEEKYQKIKKQ